MGRSLRSKKLRQNKRIRAQKLELVDRARIEERAKKLEALVGKPVPVEELAAKEEAQRKEAEAAQNGMMEDDEQDKQAGDQGKKKASNKAQDIPDNLKEEDSEFGFGTSRRQQRQMWKLSRLEGRAERNRSKSRNPGNRSKKYLVKWN